MHHCIHASPTRLIIGALAIPSILAIYYYNRPLPLSKLRKIQTNDTISHPFTPGPSSKSLEIVNPRTHKAGYDSRSITLLKSEIKKLENGEEVGDEEILARFVKGFFGGWSFTPERTLLGVLSGIGRKLVEVGFSEMPITESQIQTLQELSKTKLPQKGTVLFGGNFMILDIHLHAPNYSSNPESAQKHDEEESRFISYVDIGFGDDRKNFSGMHRFEVQHDAAKDEEANEVTIWYSSLSCNPSINRLPFPGLVFSFHRWYAMCLFRDGMERVIRG